MTNIRAWLEDLGFGTYAEAFEANEIDLDLIRDLDDAALEKLGVSVMGHRVRMLRAIADLATTPPDHHPPETAPTQAERRQLTVMFCDLVGSTALSEKLDPEDLRAVMAAYRRAAGAVIERYGGHVAQYLGDGLMVYFGWPRAHEDDAERAVRAGFDVIEAVKTVTAPAPLQVRIGIATGPVVVGEGADDDAQANRLAVGETPNLAARLQGLAGADRIVVGPGTHRLVGGAFEYDDLGPCNLKGIVEPVPAWRVTGASAAQGRFEAQAAGGLTPLVGREAEIALMVGRWRQACDGDGQVVLLSGEPGIGKSRLLEVLRERIADQPHVRLRYQCSPYHTNSAFYPVIDQLERAADFTRDDNADAKLDKLESLLTASAENVVEVAPLFAALLWLPVERYPPLNLAPQRQKDLTIDALTGQVLGLAKHQPVLLLFEDAQWCDPTTLDALTALVNSIRDRPVLIVITYRPEFEPPWIGQGHVVVQSLSRLARRQGADMIDSVTGGKHLPEEVGEQIVAKTDGIPLFVEELTKTVLESGVLRETDTSYELDGPLPPLAIPTTLQDSLMARLDRLSAVKEVAQIGACIGREFSFELLVAVSSKTDNELHDALDQLIDSALIFHHGTSTKAGYVFKHALVQEVAYSSLLKGRRQQLHARIAEVLKTQFGDLAEAQPEVLAGHLSMAGLSEQASQQWLAAGRRAAQRSANVEALAHFRAGLADVALLDGGPAAYGIEIDLQAAIGTTLFATAGPGSPEIAAAFARASVLSEKLDDPRRLFTTLIGQGTNLFIRSDFTLAWNDQMLSVAKALQNTLMLVVSHRTRGSILQMKGKFSAAREHLETALDLYRPEEHRAASLPFGHEPLVAGRSLLSNVKWVLGYPDQALEISDKTIDSAHEIEHTHSLAFALNYAAWVRYFLHDLNGVCDFVDQLIAFSEEHKFPVWLETAKALRGWTLGQQGEPAAGLALIQEGLTNYRAFGGVLSQPFLLSLLAETHARVGDFAASRTALDGGLSHAYERGERWWLAELHRAKAELLMAAANENCDEAEAELGRAIEIAQGQHAKSFELRAATSLARLWQSQGKPNEARDLLSPVYDRFTEGFETKDLIDAKALLDTRRA